MHNILLHSQAFGHSKTDVQLRICTLFRLIDSLRASSPFGDIVNRRRARASRGLLAQIRERACRLTHRLFFILCHKYSKFYTKWAQ